MDLEADMHKHPMAWADGLVQDARCAFRSMRRFPVATVSIASLAAGIGATAATPTMRWKSTLGANAAT